MTGQGAGKTTHEFFDVSIDAGVAHLQLNRPDALNTMARGFWNELPVIVRDIDENARPARSCMSSTGKHFCAGMDLTVFTGNGALAEDASRIRTSPTRPSATWSRGLQETFSCLDEARMPVIARFRAAASAARST